MNRKFIPRDVSWLAFNKRVLQEAQNKEVPLLWRIKYLGIFSNNMDEFFRVRVAGLKRAMRIKDIDHKATFFEDPHVILEEINDIVLEQRAEFDNIWKELQNEMAKERVYIKTADDLFIKQKKFVRKYYNEEVEANIIPLLLNEERPMPYIRDKSLYLGIVLQKSLDPEDIQLAAIEVPTKQNGRFVILPSPKGEKHVILLEEIIKFNLPIIFSYFGFYNVYANAFKITKDAEFDIDNDINTTLAQKIAQGVKSRRKGKATRFVFDKNLHPKLQEFIINKLNLTKRDSIIPGASIHNFKHFMDFPNLFKSYNIPKIRKPFKHPRLLSSPRVTDIVLKEDVLLSLPYHTFRPVIDLLREAAMDPAVQSIQVTAYRLASNSKVANALINAARNGKQVTAMLELRARFDEENNLYWKEILETEGIEVLVGIPNKKIHAKLCRITKFNSETNENISYGFISTGNINEKTAALYGDYCLLTADQDIMEDIRRVFNALNSPETPLEESLAGLKNLIVSPTDMRKSINKLIDHEIHAAKKGKTAKIIVKINSLSDNKIIKKLYLAAEAGVAIHMIVRGIYCALNQSNFKTPIRAISIVDEFLEHARVMYFHHSGEEKVFISSADWMTRNIDHRVEAAVEITALAIKKQLIDMLNIQLQDNVKARILDNELSNEFVRNDNPECRSQLMIHEYLTKLTY